MRNIALIADLHCGHRVGLTPPTYNSDSEAHGGRVGARLRARLWDFFKRGADSLGPWDAVIVVGDAVDGKGVRSGGTELITTDRMEQAEMAALCINSFGRKPTKYLLYGTPYHAGGDEDWEDTVASLVGAARIESEGHYQIDGYRVNARHHIGNTSAVASRFTALSKEQVRNLLWAEYDQQPRADLIVRAHIHRPAFCGEPGQWMALTLPALQGLGSKFGARRSAGMPVRFGFARLRVERGAFDLDWHILNLKTQAAKVTRV